MPSRETETSRKTKETDISLTLNPDGGEIEIETGLPFFDHLLTAMAFHGGIGFKLKASGDLEVDPHHLVEDTGIVLGTALRKTVEDYGTVKRFGYSVIPMDDALSEITIDAGGRPYLVFSADFPQEYSGSFHMPLLKEFFTGLANSGGITLHALCRYGENSHHMAEALFKALGRAVSSAYSLNEAGSVLSTKGSL